jgi:hypothetical protein
MTSSVIELVPFRLVAQFFNQLRDHMPPYKYLDILVNDNAHEEPSICTGEQSILKPE